MVGGQQSEEEFGLVKLKTEDPAEILVVLQDDAKLNAYKKWYGDKKKDAYGDGKNPKAYRKRWRR